ncbi:MAG: DUF1778 domain-containing protein [Verrucomicrobiales bacterium]|nr:DUF1778 domain-containing protein [Verrucomicrobiales bacterium]
MSTVASTLRSDRLVARVTPNDKALLERAAGIEGCSVAAFVVSCAREAAEKVVRRHETIQLNRAESLRFAKALLAPPKAPSKRLKEAVTHYRATVKER